MAPIKKEKKIKKPRKLTIRDHLNINRALDDCNSYIVFIREDPETGEQKLINKHKREVILEDFDRFERDAKSQAFKTPTIKVFPIAGEKREYLENHYPQIIQEEFELTGKIGELLNNKEEYYSITLLNHQEKLRIRVENIKGTIIGIEDITQEQYQEIEQILKPLTNCGSFVKKDPKEDRLTYTITTESPFGKGLIQYLTRQKTLR